jgi:hypothetical protein
MPFQSVVNTVPALGVAGDFASVNPRSTVLAGAGALVAASGGAIVGHFCWSTDGVTVASTGTGAVLGFVAREQQALITTYLAEASNSVPTGFPVTVYSAGDFFATNAGSGAVTRGLKAFANLADGSIQFAAAGATVAGAIETKWIAASAVAAGELVKISTHLLG